MEIFDRFTTLDNVSLALGFFDGVHRGHQAVISNNDGYKKAVITFKKHPMETFAAKDGFKYINTRERRAELIESLGADYLFELDFTEDLSRMDGGEYLKMLVDYFHPKSITTGFNHTFGRKKSGDPNLLEEKQKEYGYTYTQIPPQTLDGDVISSTAIKESLSKGEIEKANSMLGYNFSLKGKVIHGNHIGRTIGFPTANILYPETIVDIPFGVYCTEVNGRRAVTNYGRKPTVGDFQPVVETHILNFDKNIYNTDIEIKFIKKIRDEKKFDSLNELKTQINKDTQVCSK